MLLPAAILWAGCWPMTFTGLGVLQYEQYNTDVEGIDT
jgi:hypothetical protein